MKKICMFVCCVFVSMSAFAAKDCADYGISVGEWLLEKDSSNWRVWKCENNKSFEPKLSKEEKEIQFCDNPNESLESLVGWESRSFKGNAMLRVKTSDIKNANINGTGNIALRTFNDKNTACFYCDDGYSYDSRKKECIQDMAQSCTQLSIEKCKTNTHLIESGGNGCYVCDNGLKASCRAGNRLFMIRAHIGKQADVENQVWECNPATKTWTHRTPSLCNGSVDLSADVRLGHATLELVNPARSLSHNNASSWVVGNGDICYKYACNDDWILSGGKCVQDADYKTICKNSGGIYNEGTLRCDCAEIKGLKPTKDNKRCVCIDGDDYAWDKDAMNSTFGILGACVKTQQAQQREEKQKQQAQKEQQQKRQQQQNAERECRDSGGSWANNVCTCRIDKNLVGSNGKCECKGVDFRFESADVGCVETDDSVRRKNCEAAAQTGAYWDGQKCQCLGADMVFFDGKCQKSLDAQVCESASDTKWNSMFQKCECKKTGYEWNGVNCEASEEFIMSQQIQKINDLAGQIDSKINDLGGELKKWRNIDGSFNTARLASDSIAGVVLGTVGGVVTSSIIKKNQVADGFEDIKCAIGGQSVASYGDQFSVGLQ